MSSGFQYQGRRLADSKPVVRGSLTSDLYTAGVTDIESAWGSMGKAKSALRRVENRVSEAERPPPFGADANGSNFSVPVDRVPSYTVPDSALDRGHGAVDSFGRTPYMRSKMASSRKVSRLEDKYKEEEEPSHSHSHHPRAKPLPSEPRSHRAAHSSSSKPSGSSSHADYQLRHTGVDSMMSASSARSDLSTLQKTANVTDPRALRETEIRHLNEDFEFGSSLAGKRDLRDTGYGTGKKFTRVDVTVPSSYRPAATYPSTHVQDSGRHPSHYYRDRDRDRREGDRDRDRETAKPSSTKPEFLLTEPPHTDTTYTVSENSFDRNTRRTLKNLDQNEHGLDRVKELIKRQRLYCSPKDSVSDSLEKDGGREAKKLGAKPQHFDDEPVQPKKYELYNDGEKEPVRKIAAGPPAPAYRGFSETETRYRAPDGSIVKLSDLKRQVKRSKALQKLELEKRGKEGSRKVGGSAPSREVDDKPPKPARVVSRKKSSKHEKTDIITTSSWRAGQNAILRELGPNKVSKSHGTTTPTAKTERQSTDRGTEDPPSASDYIEDRREKEPPTNRNLSEQAKSVLVDLQQAHSDSEPEREEDAHLDKSDHRQKSSRRRRQPKGHSKKEEKPAEKIRHYDSDKVRRYIAKQKALRKHKQQEEREERQKAEQTKQKQLEELYRRQKASARHTRTKTGEGQRRSQHSQQSPSRHQQDKSKQGSGSDKENRGSHPWSDTSSDSATLTDGSAAETTETTARDKKDAKDAKSSAKTQPKTSQPKSDVDELIQKYTAQPPPPTAGATPSVPGIQEPASGLTVNDIMEKYRLDTGMNLDDIIAKYSKQAEAIGSGPSAGGRSGYTASSSLPPREPPTSQTSRPYSAFTAGSGYKSRAERIQAIQQTSVSLQHRLQQERQKLANRMEQDSEPGKWAYPVAHDNSDANFLSRYDRITGKNDDYTVFTTDLPGVRSVSEAAYRAEEEKSQNQAASRIQAAYRGHSVRQNLAWRVPQHKQVPTHRQRASDRGLHYKDLGLKGLSDDSLVSDSTLTDDDPSFDHKQIGAGLRAVDFHGSGHSSAGSGDDLFPRPAVPRSTKPVQRWDKPQPDPYSVLNVYARKSQYRPTSDPVDRYMSRPPLTSSELLQSHLTQATSAKSLTHAAKPYSPQSSDHEDISRQSRSQHFSRSQRSATPEDVDYQDDFTSIASVSAASSRNARSRSSRDATSQRSRGSGSAPREATTPTRSKAGSSRSRGLDRSGTRSDQKSDDDTLDGTLTPSKDADKEFADSEPEAGPDSQACRSLVPSHQSLSGPPGAEDSDLSEISSLGDGEEGRRDPLAHYSRGAGLGDGYASRTAGYSAPKMSPSALGQRMSVELHLLDTMEESLRQVTDVDRTRAVTLAQQETVSLAQILKARKQEHSQDMLQLQLKAQQESIDATNQLEEARRRAADATQNAAQAIAEVRNETTSSYQETAKKFIATQAEAAKATAEAARQLAEAKAAITTQPPVSLQSQQEFSRLATETAAAAASAAVSASLQQLQEQRIHKGRTDHSTQYSRGSLYSSTGASRTDYSQSYASDSYDSPSYSQTTQPSVSRHSARAGQSAATDGKTESIQSASIATASDASAGGATRRTDSSIHTEPSAAGPASPGDSRTESVQEDITSEKGDYSMEFDSSELDQSLRDVLPDESKIKKIKRDTSLNQPDWSFSSDEFLFQAPVLEAPSARRLSFEDDSFTRFTTDMVRQYMKEEELRAQHKNTLLKLRESALKEKTQAELAWLEQQKQRIRQKGTDDAYPQIKKRQRGLIMRLQQEQAEIKRLQEANKVASRERQLMLLQSEEIQRIRQSAQKVFSKLGRRNQRVKQWLQSVDLQGSFLSSDCSSVFPEQVSKKLKLKRTAIVPPDGAATEDELSLHLDEPSDARSSSPGKMDKDYKSDSEVYGESNGGRPPSPDLKAMHNLRKMKLDEKYLTAREQRLRHRRRQLEEMMAWKERLDQEEASVKRMEAVLARDGGKKSRSKDKDAAEKTKTRKLEPKEKGADTPRTLRTDTSIATETLPSVSERESPRSKSVAQSVSATSISDQHVRTASDSSVPEDISESKSESQEIKKTHDSSDDTIVNSSANEDYTNETFESGTEATQTRTQTQTAAAAAAGKAAAKHSPSRDGTASYGGTGSQSRLSKLAKQKGLDLKGPKSPLRSPGAKDGRKGSESESDDSFSVPYSAETVSDQSDVEGRIRALSDELQRRKMEAERLRQEKKKKEKEKLKEQEKHLKKKIEDYDMYITQMQSEISEEDQEAVVNGVQPVIRHPGGTAASTAESKKHKQQQQRESAGEASPVAVEGKPQTPPASKKSSLGRIEEDRPRKMQRDTLEISEDIPTDVVTAADSEAESGLNLKLQLDRDDGEVDRGTTPTPRSGVTDARGQDTARSLSEIPEEYTQSVQSARSETDVPSFKGESARSAYTEDSESRSERSESSQQSRSTVSTESKSYSDDFSGSSSTTVEASGPVESSKRDLVLKEKEKSVTEQEESIAESIQTEGGISDIESDADKELYIDLKAGEAPEVQQEGSLIDPLAQFQIGDRVLVRGGCAGWLRFKGRTQFAEGFWAGVELDKAEGSTNGTRDAVEYFTCRESHGTFVPASDVQRLPDNFQTEESTAQMREESSVAEDFSAATDSGLLQITKDVVPPASTTTTKTPHANESLVNKLTEELMQGVIEDSVDTMQNIRAKSPVDVLEVSPEAESVTDRAGGSTKQKEQASEVVTQNLFNEAITQMLNIRKRKKDSVQQTEDLVDASADKQPRTTDDSVDVSADSKADSSSKAESEASDGGGLLGSLPPLAGNKDAGVVSESELEEIYKSFQEPSDWWDDDDPLGAAVKPPPPYQEPAGSGQQEASGPFMRKDLKLELDRLTEVFYVVPHSEAEANDLADKAVDIFWELRRYGESWDDVEIPDGYFSPRDRIVDMEGRSRKAYKKLVFDLTAEILREMYKEELEEEEEVQPWTRNKPAKRKYHRDQAPPTTCEVLKPIVRAHVSKYLGLEPKAGQKLGKWTGRRKKDRVDQLLVQELREEEPEWVNYDRDEVAVKMQLVDTIFESLLQETVTVIGNIYSRRNDWDETQD